MKLTALTIIAALSAMAGCSAVAPVPIPDGGQGVAIICFRSISNCYKSASKACHGGPWHIIDDSNAMRPDPQIIIACGKGDKP